MNAFETAIQWGSPKPEVELILIRLEMPGLDLGLETGKAWASVFKVSVCAALRERDALFEVPASMRTDPAKNYGDPHVVAFGQKAIADFWVTDRAQALAAARSALEALGLLPQARIAWKDFAEDCFRYWFPAELSGSIFSAGEIDREMLAMISRMKE